MGGGRVRLAFLMPAVKGRLKAVGLVGLGLGRRRRTGLCSAGEGGGVPARATFVEAGGYGMGLLWRQRRRGCFGFFFVVVVVVALS